MALPLATAATAEFAIELNQRGLPNRSSYQRSEYSRTGRVKYGSFENDSGTMMNNGAIRNSNTATAKPTTAIRIKRSEGVA